MKKKGIFVLLIAMVAFGSSFGSMLSFAAQKHGDLNFDQSINSIDFGLFRMHLLGSKTLSDTIVADLNGDGNANSLDFALLRLYLLGQITVFPVDNTTPVVTSAIPTPTFTHGQADTWIGTWACAPQLTEQSNLPPSPGLSNNTLRQVVHVSIGGSQLRLKFSNEYGNSPLTMNSVYLALSAGADSIKSNSAKAVTFGGKGSVTIPAGKTVTSDTLSFDLPKLSNVAVTTYFGATPSNITGHPGSRTTSYLMSGNKVNELSMASAAKTDHWYIINGIDVLSDKEARAVVTLGDSITDGRGSTTNGNDRWPDFLARRLLSNDATSKVGVLNQGIGGNAILSGGLGPTALTRFSRDVLEQSGVRYVIVFEGVNDIGTGASSQNLINAYKEFITKAHEKNIRVYGATILPFKGNSYYSASHEKVRKEVNKWIRTSGSFDSVIDFDAVVRDQSNTEQLQRSYDSGDGLHLSPAGYKAMADKIDLSLFTK